MPTDPSGPPVTPFPPQPQVPAVEAEPVPTEVPQDAPTEDEEQDS